MDGHTLISGIGSLRLKLDPEPEKVNSLRCHAAPRVRSLDSRE